MERTYGQRAIAMLGIMLLAAWLTGCVGTPIKLNLATGLEAPDKVYGEQNAMFFQRDGQKVTLMAYGLTKDSVTAVILGLGGAAIGGAAAGAPGAIGAGLGGALIGRWNDANTSRTLNAAGEALRIVPQIDRGVLRVQ